MKPSLEEYKGAKKPTCFEAILLKNEAVTVPILKEYLKKYEGAAALLLKHYLKEYEAATAPILKE